MLDLINACLNMDPLKRPTATQLLQHPFFADIPRLLAADPELQQLLAAPQTKVPLPLQAPVPGVPASVVPSRPSAAAAAAAAPAVSNMAPCSPAAAAPAAAVASTAVAAPEAAKLQTACVATPEAMETDSRATAGTRSPALPSRTAADAQAPVSVTAGTAGAAESRSGRESVSAATSQHASAASAMAEQGTTTAAAQHPQQVNTPSATPAVAVPVSSTASPTAPSAPPAHAPIEHGGSAFASAVAAAAAAVEPSAAMQSSNQEPLAAQTPPEPPVAAINAAAAAAVSRIPAPGLALQQSASLPPPRAATTSAPGATATGAAAAQSVAAMNSGARLPVASGTAASGSSSSSAAAPCCTYSGALATASNVTTPECAAAALTCVPASVEHLHDLTVQTAGGSASAGATQRAGAAPASGVFSGAAVEAAPDAAANVVCAGAVDAPLAGAAPTKKQEAEAQAGAQQRGPAEHSPAAAPTCALAAAQQPTAVDAIGIKATQPVPPPLPAVAVARRSRLPPLDAQGSEAGSASGSEDVAPSAPHPSAGASTMPVPASAAASAPRGRSVDEGAKRGVQDFTAAPSKLNMTTGSLAVGSAADAADRASASPRRPDDLLGSPRLTSGAQSERLFDLVTGSSRASKAAWPTGESDGPNGLAVDGGVSQQASQMSLLQPRPPAAAAPVAAGAAPGGGARPSPSPSQQTTPRRVGWSLDGRSLLPKLQSIPADASAAALRGSCAPPAASATTAGMAHTAADRASAGGNGTPPSAFTRANVGPSTARVSGNLQLRQSMSGLCPVNENQQHLHPLDVHTPLTGASSTRLPPLLLATAMRSSARGSAAADAVASMLSGELGSLGCSGGSGGGSASGFASASHLPFVFTPAGAPMVPGAGGHHRRLPHQRPPPLAEPYVPPALGIYDSCTFPPGSFSGMLSGPLLSGALPSGIFANGGGGTTDNGLGSFGLGLSLGSMHTYSPSAFQERSSIPGSRGSVTPRGAGNVHGSAGGSGSGPGSVAHDCHVSHLNALADRMVAAQSSASGGGGGGSGPSSILGLGQNPESQALSATMAHWPADGVLDVSGVVLDCNSQLLHQGSPHTSALDLDGIEHAAASAAAAHVYLATSRSSLHGGAGSGPSSFGNQAGSGPNSFGNPPGSGPNSFGWQSVPGGAAAAAGGVPGGLADSQSGFRTSSVGGSNGAVPGSSCVVGISGSASVTGDYTDQPNPFRPPNSSRSSSSNLEAHSGAAGGMATAGLAPQPPSQPQQQSSSRFTRQSPNSVANSNHSVRSVRRGPSRLGQAPGSIAGGMNLSHCFTLTRTTSQGFGSNTASGDEPGDALTAVTAILNTRCSYNGVPYGSSASMDGRCPAPSGGAGAGGAVGAGVMSGTLSDIGGAEGLGVSRMERGVPGEHRSMPIPNCVMESGSPDPYEGMQLMQADPPADLQTAAAAAAVEAAVEATAASMSANAAAALSARAHVRSVGMPGTAGRPAAAAAQAAATGGWAIAGGGAAAEARFRDQHEAQSHLSPPIEGMADSATAPVHVEEMGTARRPASIANMHSASPIVLGGLVSGDDGTPAPIPAGSGRSSISMHGGDDHACHSRRSVVSIASAVLAVPYSFTLPPPNSGGGAQVVNVGAVVSASGDVQARGSGEIDSATFAQLRGLYTTPRLSVGGPTSAEDEAVAAPAKRPASSSDVNTFSRLASGFRRKVEKTLKMVLS